VFVVCCPAKRDFAGAQFVVCCPAKRDFAGAQFVVRCSVFVVRCSPAFGEVNCSGFGVREAGAARIACQGVKQAGQVYYLCYLKASHILFKSFSGFYLNSACNLIIDNNRKSQNRKEPQITQIITDNFISAEKLCYLHHLNEVFCVIENC
jgi:hypothetical protein